MPADDVQHGYICARCGLPLGRDRVTRALHGPDGTQLCASGEPHVRRYYEGDRLQRNDREGTAGVSATRIYRYRLPLTDRPTIRMPARFDVLSIGPARDGRDQLDLWAMVDPDAEPVDVPFRVVGTGHKLDRHDDEAFLFVGTTSHHGGALIFHVFEIVPAVNA